MALEQVREQVEALFITQEQYVDEWIAEMRAASEQQQKKLPKLDPIPELWTEVGKAVEMTETFKIAQDRAEVAVIRARIAQRKASRIISEVASLVFKELERARLSRLRAEEAIAEADRLMKEIESLRANVLNAAAQAKATLHEMEEKEME